MHTKRFTTITVTLITISRSFGQGLGARLAYVASIQGIVSVKLRHLLVCSASFRLNFLCIVWINYTGMCREAKCIVPSL